MGKKVLKQLCPDNKALLLTLLLSSKTVLTYKHRENSLNGRFWNAMHTNEHASRKLINKVAL